MIRKTLRNSGLDIVGPLPWGTHFCQFYKTQDDLSDTLVRYFKAGLENNEFCVWVTSEFLTREEAVRDLKKHIPNFSKYLKKGQIEIFPYTDWYLKQGKFEMNRVLKMWKDKHDEGLARGYDGIRVSGNPFWIDNKKDWDDFAAYEAEINKVIGPYKILVLCTYSLEKCQASEIIDVVNNHEFALIKKENKWQLIKSAQQRKSEELLKASEKRFQETLDNLLEGCQIISPDYRYIYINNAAARHGRSKKEDLLGWEMTKVYPGIEKTKVFLKIKKCMEQRTPLSMETEFIFQDGEKGWFQLSMQPVPEGVFILSVDITERKKIEEEISHIASFPLLNINPIVEINIQGEVIFANPVSLKLFPGIKEEGLKHAALVGINLDSVKKTTKLLIREVAVRNKWYRQAIIYVSETGSVRIYNNEITERKKLEQLKDEFLGVASHELKTPVTSIKAYAQVLQKVFTDKGDLFSAEMLSKMDKQVDRIIVLITNLLDITKIQEGKMEFNKSFFDFSGMMKEVVEEVQRVSRRHKIINEFAKTGVVYGDRDRLSQVVINFLTNATKYSPEKDKVIVKTQVKGKQLTVSVQDFGSGIPKGKQQKVFDRFYRLQQIGSRTPTGLGLGLYISSEIIKRHKGDIWVDSIPGKGSTFYFRIPVKGKEENGKEENISY